MAEERAARARRGRRVRARVTMLWDSAEARMCLPASVDGVPVRVLARNPGAGPVRRTRE
jgi:hypothetical protein